MKITNDKRGVKCKTTIKKKSVHLKISLVPVEVKGSVERVGNTPFECPTTIRGQLELTVLNYSRQKQQIPSFYDTTLALVRPRIKEVIYICTSPFLLLL